MLDWILWWAVLALFGIAALPFVEQIFPASFPDRGYAFAKPLALVVFGYVSWLLTSAGVPQRISLGITVGAIAIAAIVGWRRRVGAPPISVYVREEALFLFAFAVFGAVRALSPEIFGAEKYMDFAFFNTLLRAEHFPPEDPWMAGVPINYYYFGYLLFANVARLSAIAPAVAYNLSLVTIGAIAAATAASVGTRLSGRRPGGILAAVALVAIGNLDAARQLFLEHRGLAAFDYWRSTRVVPHTINEFPFFSVMHGDLHPHVSALVIALALIGVALATYDATAEEPRRTRANLARLGLVALLLGAIAIANPWDVPVYLTLLGLSALARLWDDVRWLRALVRIGVLLAVLVAAMTLLALPFTARFHAQYHGIARVHERTALVPFLTVFGFLLLPAVLRLAERVAAELRCDPAARDLAISAGAFAIAVLYVATQSAVLIVCVALAVASLLEILESPGRGSHGPVVLVATAAVAIGAAELVFLRDPYGEEFHRMNTVFKLYFQAWVLLALAFAPLALDLLERWRGLAGGAARGVFAVGLAASLCYPVAALELRRGAMRGGLSLDGQAYLDRDHADDAAAIRWIAATADGTPVVLEASGEAYSYFARVSSNTGLPTLLGWANHEGVWRGGDPRIAERRSDIDALYADTDITRVRSLLARYGVRYVFVGELERQHHPAAGLAKFDAYPDVFQRVFESHATRIFEVR